MDNLLNIAMFSKIQKVQRDLIKYSSRENILLKLQVGVW
jgi:hypothetical protein